MSVTVCMYAYSSACMEVYEVFSELGFFVFCYFGVLWSEFGLFMQCYYCVISGFCYEKPF